MRWHPLFAVFFIASAVAARAEVLIDFGMNGVTPAGGFPDQRTAGSAPTWNNLAIGTTTGTALAVGAPVKIAQNGGLPTLDSAALVDTAGLASGWTISFSTAGTGGNVCGTSGTGGNYSGAVPPVAAAVFSASSATRDEIYINSATATLTVTITGLSDAQRYDLTALSARDAAVTGGTWTLVTGAATIARFQNSAGTFTENTGQAIAPGGSNAGIAAQWLDVSPVGGTIAFRMQSGSSSPVDLNAMSLGLTTQPPQPAQPVHMAFHNATASHDAMDAASAPTTQGSVVDTATTHWNNLQSTAAYTFTNVPLLSANGTGSGAVIGGTTGYTGNNVNGWSITSKDGVMMEGWFGFRGSESVTVSQLPGNLAQRYHVIIYGDSGDPSRVMNYTLGGVTRTNRSGPNFNGTFTAGQDYVVFTGLSGSAFTITGNSAGGLRSAINGLSIVPGHPIAVQSFTASDLYVSPGSAVTLSWLVDGADSVEISPGIGLVTGNSRTVNVSMATTFTLTARNDDETVVRTLRVAVGPPRPNLVVFLVDDMGWQDTSVPFLHDAAGNPVVTGFNQRFRTPQMAALAASGMKFTNAYSCPVCTPTRISLMTGQSAVRHGVTQFTAYHNYDPSGVSATLKSPLSWNVNGLAPASDTATTRTWRTSATLPALLQEAGYRTILSGKAHFGAKGRPGEDPETLGFDINIAGHAAGNPNSFLGTANYGTGDYHVPDLEEYHGTDTFLTEALTLEANKAVEKAVQDGAPFYLYMPHYAVHTPLTADARFQGNYPTLDTPEMRYASMIEGMDKSLGDLRAKLQQLGVAENTLILFYADNGGFSAGGRGTTPAGTGLNTHNKPLRAGKGSAYEGGTRIPAIASWAAANPANPFQQQLPIAANSRCDKPMVVEDIYPTMLDVAGVTKPASLDGESVTRYLTSDPSYVRAGPLLFHYPHIWNASYIGMNEGYEMHSSLRDGDWKIIHYYEGSRWELYHLATDLGEATNLAPSRPDLVLPLGRKMIRLLRERNAQFPTNRTTNLAQPPVLPNNNSVDSDGDGLTDLQEDPNRNGVVDPGETDPDGADTDGDGTSDGAEARLGTDPLDPSSFFRLAVQAQPGTPVTWRLSWPSLPGTTFTIRSSPDLADWTTIVVQNLPAASQPAQTTSYDLLAPAAAKRFFRVSLE